MLGKTMSQSAKEKFDVKGNAPGGSLTGDITAQVGYIRRRYPTQEPRAFRNRLYQSI